MIRVGVVCHGQTIEFNAKDTKAIAEAASALGVCPLKSFKNK